MFRRISSLTLFLLFALGVFRWEVVQVRMYGRMIADRSAEGSLIEAIESTFSGHAPCGQCLVITRERSQDTTESFIPRDAGLPAHWCPLSEADLDAPRVKTLRHVVSAYPLYTSPVPQPAVPPPRFLQMT